MGSKSNNAENLQKDTDRSPNTDLLDEKKKEIADKYPESLKYLNI